MAINPVIDLDLKLDQMVARRDELKPKGFRLLSLSMYGDPEDARFAAVWDKRDGPDWSWALSFTVHDLIELTEKNKKKNLFPRIVTATGGGVTNARISVVFEKLDPPKTRELTPAQTLKTFTASIPTRLQDGWIPVTATIYDDEKHEPRIGTVWGRNSGNTAWTAFVRSEPTQVKDDFEAQVATWARLAFVTASTRGNILTIYRDDQVGPIGMGFAAGADMSRDQFDERKKQWQKDKLHPVCLQVSGPENNRRFAAVAVTTDKLVGRVVRFSGGPVVTQIDDAVVTLMKKSNIRGAALAIVKGTKLVLARGYTWAEPDYPDVQPTTVFRLGSVSKFVTALSIHQLAAEGRIKLTDKVAKTLPLKPPNKLPAANDKYLNGEVHELIEKSANVSPRYEPASEEIAQAFKKVLPVTHEQIAKFWITKPLEADNRLDDFGFFLAGQIVKTKRNQDLNLTMMKAAERITEPLQIKRIRSARSLLVNQGSDEARYHSRDLVLNETVMSGSPDHPRTLVAREYGDENLETMEASGGLSAAVTDLARVLAAMNAAPYSPLGRPAIDKMLKSAVDNDGGHGFDNVEEIDPVNGKFAFRKGGLLQTTQAGLYYSQGEFSYVVVWNGLHTGTGFKLDKTIEPEWYPKFNKVLTAAASQTWADVDMFNQFDMDSFAPTQDGFSWCKKCQGLFHGAIGGSCPAGGSHDKSESANYVLMHSAALPYGEANWRQCQKCRGLFFDGTGAKKCPASKTHQGLGTIYHLVKNSPYKEHQRKWRRCKKCAGLFFQGKKASVCPASGTHDDSLSDDYSLAFS